MLIRIGQGGAAGGRDTQVFQLPLTASQTPGNLPEGMSSIQLTEEHGHKLSPAGESPSMPLGFRFYDCLLELISRKQLQELADYATKFFNLRLSFDWD